MTGRNFRTVIETGEALEQRIKTIPETFSPLSKSSNPHFSNQPRFIVKASCGLELLRGRQLGTDRWIVKVAPEVAE